MRAAKRISEEFTGAGPHVIELDPAYFKNQISLFGVDTGTFAFRAWAADGDDWEQIEDGSLDVAENRTLMTDGYLQKIEITPPSAVDFGATVRQTNPVSPF